MTISWPTAIVLLGALAVLAGGVYLERGNEQVQHAVVALIVAALAGAAAALPALVRKAPPS